MPTATATIADLEASALAEWRKMVRATARTGKQPDGVALLNAGLTLGYSAPGERFAAEVEATAAYGVHAAELKRLRAEEADEAVAIDTRTERLAALEREAEELRRTMFAKSWSLGSAVMDAEMAMAKLVKQYPFLGGDA